MSETVKQFPVLDPRFSPKIRYRARKAGLVASCRTVNHHQYEGCRARLWWFSDMRNFLQSPEHGLTDEEALAFVQPEKGGADMTCQDQKRLFHLSGKVRTYNTILKIVKMYDYIQEEVDRDIFQYPWSQNNEDWEKILGVGDEEPASVTSLAWLMWYLYGIEPYPEVKPYVLKMVEEEGLLI